MAGMFFLIGGRPLMAALLLTCAQLLPRCRKEGK
jgi:hypothetical protein